MAFWVIPRSVDAWANITAYNMILFRSSLPNRAVPCRKSYTQQPSIHKMINLHWNLSFLAKKSIFVGILLTTSRKSCFILYKKTILFKKKKNCQTTYVSVILSRFIPTLVYYYLYYVCIWIINSFYLIKILIRNMFSRRNEMKMQTVWFQSLVFALVPHHSQPLTKVRLVAFELIAAGLERGCKTYWPSHLARSSRRNRMTSLSD